jgi:hypothetical protein
VVCRIRGDLREHYPADLPIVSADPDSVYAVLEGLVTRPETWADLGGRGTAYVLREHEMHDVARRVMDVYELEAGVMTAGAAAR